MTRTSRSEVSTCSTCKSLARPYIAMPTVGMRVFMTRRSRGRALLSKRIAADVVGFQELWVEEALAAVLRKAGMDSSYKALVPPAHPGDRIVNAAAVRRDIYVEDSACWIVCFPNELVLRSTGDDPQQTDICILLDSFSRPVLNFRVQVHPSTPENRGFRLSFQIPPAQHKSGPDTRGTTRTSTDRTPLPSAMRSLLYGGRRRPRRCASSSRRRPRKPRRLSSSLAI